MLDFDALIRHFGPKAFGHQLLEVEIDRNRRRAMSADGLPTLLFAVDWEISS
jgi:hypothetical protein